MKRALSVASLRAADVDRRMTLAGDTLKAQLERRRVAWMLAAQSGDGRSFNLLAKDCTPLIRSVALRMGMPADRADDVVQDVLLTVHRVGITFDPTRSFNAWLTAIAARRTIDLLRVITRQYAREIHEPNAYDAYVDDADLPFRSLEAAERTRFIDSAMPLLPSGQREAVRRLGLEEQSLCEASRETGRSKGALKVSLHRAIRNLRRLVVMPVQ